jgi:hypothetical protein
MLLEVGNEFSDKYMYNHNKRMTLKMICCIKQIPCTQDQTLLLQSYWKYESCLLLL